MLIVVDCVVLGRFRVYGFVNDSEVCGGRGIRCVKCLVYSRGFVN